MTDTTFTTTIATEDDAGNQYSQELTLGAVRDIVTRQGGAVFTYAKGTGVDTDTDASERVIVIQGYVPTAHALALLQDLLRYAAEERNQRAIGWWTSTDSYVLTPKGRKA